MPLLLPATLRSRHAWGRPLAAALSIVLIPLVLATSWGASAAGASGPKCSGQAAEVTAGPLGEVIGQLSRADEQTVAAGADTSVAELRDLAADPTVHLDGCG